MFTGTEGIVTSSVQVDWREQRTTREWADRRM